MVSRVVDLVMDTGRGLEECRERIVLLPIGSIEYHGGKLPLGTDTIVASRVTEYCMEKYNGGVCLVKTPVIPLGFSHEWLHNIGTITLSPDTMLMLLRDIIDSINASIKPSKIIIVNGHGGNYYLLKIIVKEYNYLQGYPRIYLVDIWRIARDMGLEYCHACPFEAELLNYLTGWRYSGVDHRVKHSELVEEYVPGYIGVVEKSVEEFVYEICHRINNFINR